MRHQRTYRADRKRRARERGISLAELDAQDARAKQLAAQRVHQIAMSMTPEESRRALALWAQSGGKINPLTGEGMTAQQPETFELIIDPTERPIYDALKEPQSDNPVLDGALGRYDGVTIHGRR